MNKRAASRERDRKCKREKKKRGREAFVQQGGPIDASK